MDVQPGATSLTADVQVVDDDGNGVTGLLAATFPPVAWSPGTNVAHTAITLSDLALITSAHAAGGVKERTGGYYRLDLPDAIAAAAGTKKLIGEASGKHLICEPIEVRALAVTSGAGDGAYTVTVTVATAAPAGIQGVTVSLTEGVNVYTAVTDADGFAEFDLNNGTYAVAAARAGYQYVGAAPSAITVNGAAVSRTITMAAVTIAASADPDVCVVYVRPTIDGATINYRMVTPPPDVDGVLWDKRVKTSDEPGVDGLIRVEAYRNAEYQFWYGSAGNPKLTVTVPDEDSYELPSFTTAAT